MTHSWQDTRSRMNLDEAEAAEHKERMLAEARTTQSREIHEHRDLAQ